MEYADDVKLSAVRVNTNANKAKELAVHQDEMWKGKYWDLKMQIQRKTLRYGYVESDI
jgi:hypothetical protein